MSHPSVITTPSFFRRNLEVCEDEPDSRPTSNNSFLSLRIDVRYLDWNVGSERGTYCSRFS